MKSLVLALLFIFASCSSQMTAHKEEEMSVKERTPSSTEDRNPSSTAIPDTGERYERPSWMDGAMEQLR